MAAGERGPLCIPIWYHYELGGEPWIHTPADSRKARLIADAGRFTLLVHRVEPTVRYVSVEGGVDATEVATEEHVRMLASRYLPAEAVEPYVDFTRADHPDALVIRMRPEHWLSSDLGSGT